MKKNIILLLVGIFVFGNLNIKAEETQPILENPNVVNCGNIKFERIITERYSQNKLAVLALASLYLGFSCINNKEDTARLGGSVYLFCGGYFMLKLFSTKW